MMGEIADTWEKCQKKEASKRRAYYFSAEFLMGRMMYNNLYCMGILDTTKKLLKSKGIDINVFEDIDDAALSNGGLGRLAACFLDSAATQEVPLDGYGIRYKYGLFKQLIEDGYQVEIADNWQRLKIHGASVEKKMQLKLSSRIRQLRLYLMIWLLLAMVQRALTLFVYGRQKQLTNSTS